MGKTTGREFTCPKKVKMKKKLKGNRQPNLDETNQNENMESVPPDSSQIPPNLVCMFNPTIGDMNEDVAKIEKYIDYIREDKLARWPSSPIDAILDMKDRIGGFLIYEECFSFVSDNGVKVKFTFDDPHQFYYEIFKDGKEIGFGELNMTPPNY